MLYQGRLSPPNNIGTLPQLVKVIRESQGLSSPACPHTVPKRKFFVEYNWTFAVKIVLFYS